MRDRQRHKDYYTGDESDFTELGSMVIRCKANKSVILLNVRGKLDINNRRLIDTDRIKYSH